MPRAWPCKAGSFPSNCSSRWWRWPPSPTSASALPYFIAKALNLGGGSVLAVTYEYGNTFVIVAGLLNLLVACDAWDVAAGRK